MPMKNGAREKKNSMKAKAMHIMANTSEPSSSGGVCAGAGAGATSLPHLRQNLDSSGMSDWHEGHFRGLTSTEYRPRWV